jgi:uncharacterized membrane protein
MGLERKLEEWQAAGLIGADAAAAIRSHEAEASRPLALWAAIGIGLFALALGIVLLVASGWDMIPAWTKLSVHWAMAAAAAATVWQARRRQRLWLGEGALFLFAALVLAGLALQGQVYQIISLVWQALGAWALLVSPAMLVAGRTRITAYGWAALLALLAISYAIESPRSDALAVVAADNIPAALPPALLLLGALLHGRAARPFVDGLREAGLALLLGAASLAHFAWPVAVSGPDAADMAMRLPLATLVAAIAFAAAGRLPAGAARVLRTCLAASTVAVILALGVPHGDNLPARLFGAVSFFLMWGVIAKAAHDGGWRALFGVAIAMIAVRLFIVYVELFGGLALTGIGLVVGGALLIALTLGWARVMRRRPA